MKDERKLQLRMSLARSERDMETLARELLRPDISQSHRKKVASEVLKLKKIMKAIKKEISEL